MTSKNSLWSSIKESPLLVLSFEVFMLYLSSDDNDFLKTWTVRYSETAWKAIDEEARFLFSSWKCEKSGFIGCTILMLKSAEPDYSYWTD